MIRDMIQKQVAIGLALVLVFGGALAAIGQPGIARAAAAGGINLLQNNSFEQVTNGKADGWGTHTFSGQPVLAVDNQVARTGERAFRISATETSRAAINQQIHFTSEQKGKTYHMRQWVKTANFTGSAYLRVQVFNSDGTRIAFLASSAITEAQDWSLIEQIVAVAPEADRMVLEIFFENGTGTVWYDDVQFMEPTPDPGISLELVENGSFEQVTNGKADGWNSYTFSGQPVFAVDNQVAHTGEQAYRISAAETSRAVANYQIRFTNEQKGKTYRMRQWLKTADFTGTAYLRMQVYDSDNARIAFIASDSMTEAQDWSLVEQIVEIPPEADRMVLELFFENGTGTVWYDDISFRHWIPISGIQLSETNWTMAPGATRQLTALITPADAVDPALLWTSSDSAVASVQEGLITAHSEGVALITAKGIGANRQQSASAAILVGSSRGITVPDYDAQVAQNQSISGTVTAGSDDERTFTYSKLSDPANGTIYLTSSGNWEYYPDPAFSGIDTWFAVARDEAGNQAISRIVIEVTPVAPTPRLETGIHPTNKNTPVSGNVTVLSSHTEPLLFTIEQQPLHGQVAMNPAGQWTYTPDPGHTGNDSFIVRAGEALGDSSTAVIYVYTAPTAEEMVAQLKTTHTELHHPRLLASEADFARIRDYLDGNDPQIVPWFATIKEEADSLLALPPKTYAKPDGLRLDTTSAFRIPLLAFTYQITGDEAYAERAWEELDFIAGSAYPDWSPGHYLDTAAMTFGASLGYDWLYGVLTEQQRGVIRQAIVDKGLTPAVPMYIDKTYWWVYNRDNWNLVCNAGMLMGALAIADEEEELAGLILREALKSIQFGLPQYAPDGSAKEGPGYWELGNLYLAFFLSALESALGNDFGFSQREGIADTPTYPIHIAGPQGTFNYFDNGDTLITGRLMLWFAERYNKPEYTWYHQFAQGRSLAPGIYDILWYRAELYGASPPIQLDREFAVPHAVTMRSSWNDPNALFVGFKGGENGAPHSDLDTGTFVFDANGVRWALDLGVEDYNLPSYWTMTENGARWTYYRKRAEAHNTLVIGPSSSPDQSVNSVSEIIRTAFERPEGSFAIADLTPAYRKQAVSAKRGTALLDHRRQFLVQDEVKLKAASELYWFMHTKADIELDANGTTAILSQNGRKLAVQIISPAAASFSVLEAEPLQTSPNPSGQTRNLGVKRLAIHLQDVLETTVAVKMTPLMDGDALPAINPSSIVPLEEWQLDSGELSRLSGLAVDGLPLPEFAAGRFVYDVELPKEQAGIPQVTAVAAAGLQVSVQQAGQMPGTARIEVTDPDGERHKATYYVVFKQASAITLPSEESRLLPVSVSASTDDGNVPGNTLDDNLNTRWSAEGNQWIAYDLGDSYDVAAMTIAWYQGNLRASYFQIELSDDGITWHKVYEGFSAGNTLDHELFVFEPTGPHTARYVRINGFGNTMNRWNSIAEVRIYGPQAEEPGGGEPGNGDPGTNGPGGGDSGNGAPGTVGPGGGEHHEENRNEEAPFGDIDTHWAQDAIRQAATRGLAVGYPDGTFRADRPISRAEFTVLLLRALPIGVEADETGTAAEAELAFIDRDSIGSWSRAAIAKAVKAGIVHGFEDGSFRPQAAITRVQMAAMIARALQLPIEDEQAGDFTDYRDIPAWAISPVSAVRKHGLMEGRNNNRFAPNESATRAEAIVVLIRALELGLE